MGLNRELREINRQILTDKQQRQIEKQERQQLKDLQLLEQAQKQHLQLFIKSKIQYYLDLDFSKYSNDLHLIKVKEAIKQDYLLKNKSNIDIVLLFFDDYYHKILNQQIKIYKMNQKALINNTPPQNNVGGWGTVKALLKAVSRITVVLIFLLFNILAVLCSPFQTKRRRL